MRNNTIKKAAAFLTAFAILAAASVPADSVKMINASELPGETNFDGKIYPWQAVEASPARQIFVSEYTDDNSIGIRNRKNSGTENNFISVNQLGYLPASRKIAVLGDNKGELFPDVEVAELKKTAYDFEVVDSEGQTVYTGTSQNALRDADSGDTVYKLDFSEFKEPGRYYIKVGEWRSPEFNISRNIYTYSLVTDAVNYFYQTRSETDIEEKYISSGNKSELAHSETHKTDTAYVQKMWKNNYSNENEAASPEYSSSSINAEGGWYDSGSRNKYVVNSGIAVWTLQNMYERTVINGKNKNSFSEGSGAVLNPETNNKIPDILDEAAYEIDWMSGMVVSEDEPTWGKIAAGMVYSSVQDCMKNQLSDKDPDYECDDRVRIVKPPTFAATLNYAACAAQAARLWEPYDHDRAVDYLSKARAAFDAYEKNFYYPDYKMVRHPELNCTCTGEELNPKSLYAPLWQTGSGIFSYGDFDVDDEAYWAACELFISSKIIGDSDADLYFNKLLAICYEHVFEIRTVQGHGESAEREMTSFSWNETQSVGPLSLALHMELLDDDIAVKILKSSLLNAADAYISLEKEQGYGIPYMTYDRPINDPVNLDPSVMLTGYRFGTNRMVLTNAMIMSYAYDMTGDEKYFNGVTGAMDYLLGTNPLSVSYITGYGSYTVQNPHHRFWCREPGSFFPSAPDGILVSGPNAGVQDSFVRSLGMEPGYCFSQRCYADSVEAWSVNSAGSDINASLAWVAAFLADAADKSEASTGDINGDGLIDVTDLTELALSLLGDKIPEHPENADVDKDGSVRLTDLATLKQYLSHVIESF